MNFLKNDSNDPHYNMAFDEYCLEQLRSDAPLFYLWRNRPSVIIGLNQNAYGEVNLKYLDEKGITLARRVTGGGAVYHDLQNLNYTIVGRSADLEKDYPGYLTYFIDALKTLGVPAELSGRNDIMVEGRKVSGYAKRVYKDRLMVHGTLMYDVDLQTLQQVLSVPGSKMASSGIASVRSKVVNLKDYLPEFSSLDALQAALQKILAGNDSEVVLGPEDFSAIEKMASEKFGTWEWNYGRSNDADFRFVRKFACGTVEAYVNLSHGEIVNISFSGDFIGNLPASLVASGLFGCRFTPSEVLEALRSLPVRDCFDSLSPEELSMMFFE